jgi:hypothetical protein
MFSNLKNQVPYYRDDNWNMGYICIHEDLS